MTKTTEPSLFEQLNALAEEYGFWARENPLLPDNSIIHFVHKEKLGINRWTNTR